MLPLWTLFQMHKTLTNPGRRDPWDGFREPHGENKVQISLRLYQWEHKAAWTLCTIHPTYDTPLTVSLLLCLWCFFTSPKALCPTVRMSWPSLGAHFPTGVKTEQLFPFPPYFSRKQTQLTLSQVIKYNWFNSYPLNTTLQNIQY